MRFHLIKLMNNIENQHDPLEMNLKLAMLFRYVLPYKVCSNVLSYKDYKIVDYFSQRKDFSAAHFFSQTNIIAH